MFAQRGEDHRLAWSVVVVAGPSSFGEGMGKVRRPNLLGIQKCKLTLDQGPVDVNTRLWVGEARMVQLVGRGGMMSLGFLAFGFLDFGERKPASQPK